MSVDLPAILPRSGVCRLLSFTEGHLIAEASHREHRLMPKHVIRRKNRSSREEPSEPTGA